MGDIVVESMLTKDTRDEELLKLNDKVKELERKIVEIIDN